MPYYTAAPEVEEMAKRVIKRSHPGKEKVNIGYLFREKAVASSTGRVVWGMTARVDDRNHAFSLKDVVIEIAKDIWGLLDAPMREMLVDHELCHVGFTLDEAGTGIALSEGTNRPLVSVMPHDFEDFESILDRHPQGRMKMKEITKGYLKALEAAKKKPEKVAGAKTA